MIVSTNRRRGWILGAIKLSLIVRDLVSISFLRVSQASHLRGSFNHSITELFIYFILFHLILFKPLFYLGFYNICVTCMRFGFWIVTFELNLNSFFPLFQNVILNVKIVVKPI